MLIEGFPGYKIHRHGVRILNAIIKESLDFDDADVDHEFWLCHSILQGEVNFIDSSFTKNLLFSNSQFLGKANFERIEVGKSIFFRNARFQAPVSFRTADIGVNFEADGARFLNKEEMANFNGMKVGNAAFFNKAEFQGSVNFVGAEIKSNFEADEAKFLNQEQTANFNSMEVGNIAFFKKAEFQGPVDFRLAEFKSNFEANEAKFLNQMQKASFNSMKVGGIAFFTKAEFQGPVDFGLAEIKSNFEADEAQFLYAGERGINSFSSIKIGHYAFLRNAVFLGDIVFAYGNFLDLIIKGTKPPGGKERQEEQGILSLNLDGTLINRNLTVQNIKIGAMSATNCQVKESATFQNLEINDIAEFQNSDLRDLKFISIQLPEREKLRLDGLTYYSICVEEPGDYQKVKDLLDRSRFNTQNYNELEAYFSRCGHRDWADKVFIAGKRQETAWLPWWKKWPNRIFWGGLAGYGRKPYLSLPWIIFIVALGAFVFSLDFDPKSLESQLYLKQAVISHPWVTKIILSLDRFLPGVDLGIAKHWAPVKICFWSWLYWHLQRFLGWILIPIALAAIYTRIK